MSPADRDSRSCRSAAQAFGSSSCRICRCVLCRCVLGRRVCARAKRWRWRWRSGSEGALRGILSSAAVQRELGRRSSSREISAARGRDLLRHGLARFDPSGRQGRCGHHAGTLQRLDADLEVPQLHGCLSRYRERILAVARHRQRSLGGLRLPRPHAGRERQFPERSESDDRRPAQAGRHHRLRSHRRCLRNDGRARADRPARSRLSQSIAACVDNGLTLRAAERGDSRASEPSSARLQGPFGAQRREQAELSCLAQRGVPNRSRFGRYVLVVACDSSLENNFDFLCRRKWTRCDY